MFIDVFGISWANLNILCGRRRSCDRDCVKSLSMYIVLLSCFLCHQKDLRDMSHRLSAFEVDALNSSHPLTPPAQEIQTYDQIAQMFSTITYFKVVSSSCDR